MHHLDLFHKIRKLKSETLFSLKVRSRGKGDLIYIISITHKSCYNSCHKYQIENQRCVTELSSKSFLCLLKLLPCNCLLQRLVYHHSWAFHKSIPNVLSACPYMANPHMIILHEISFISCIISNALLTSIIHPDFVYTSCKCIPPMMNLRPSLFD